jgi:hypothetical protein
VVLPAAIVMATQGRKEATPLLQTIKATTMCKEERMINVAQKISDGTKKGNVMNDKTRNNEERTKKDNAMNREGRMSNVVVTMRDDKMNNAGKMKRDSEMSSAGVTMIKDDKTNSAGRMSNEDRMNKENKTKSEDVKRNADRKKNASVTKKESVMKKRKETKETTFPKEEEDCNLFSNAKKNPYEKAFIIKYSHYFIKSVYYCARCNTCCRRCPSVELEQTNGLGPQPGARRRERSTRIRSNVTVP